MAEEWFVGWVATKGEVQAEAAVDYGNTRLFRYNMHYAVDRDRPCQIDAQLLLRAK